jgi:hypothetical protein
MKTKRYLQIAVGALALSMAGAVYAETPRQELAHAYVLLKVANNNYSGHRATALQEIEVAGRELGLDLNGRPSEHEHQLKSDELVAESGSLLREALGKLEARDRDRVAAHVDKAIQEINAALKVK